MPDVQAAAQAEAYLQEKMRELDSSGGIVECVITGMPVGIGEPVFDKLSANLGIYLGLKTLSNCFNISKIMGIQVSGISGRPL